MKTLYIDCSNAMAEEITSKILKELAGEENFSINEISPDRIVISTQSTLHPHYHPVNHSEEQKKTVINRISRIIGHLESIKRMVEDNRDANEVLTQLSAVSSSVNSTARVIIKSHFKHSIDNAIEKNDEESLDKLYGLIDKFLK